MTRATGVTPAKTDRRENCPGSHPGAGFPA